LRKRGANGVNRLLTGVRDQQRALRPARPGGVVELRSKNRNAPQLYVTGRIFDDENLLVVIADNHEIVMRVEAQRSRIAEFYDIKRLVMTMPSRLFDFVLPRMNSCGSPG
jgi:hypothetical protein